MADRPWSVDRSSAPFDEIEDWAEGMVRLIRACCPQLALALAVLVVVSAAIVPVTMILVGQIVQHLFDGYVPWATLTAFIACLAVQSAVNQIAGQVAMEADKALALGADAALLSITLEGPLRLVQSEEVQDRLSGIMGARDAGSLTGAIQALRQSVQPRLVALGSVSLLVWWQWWVAAALILAWTLLAASQVRWHSAGSLFLADAYKSQDIRRSAYMRRLLLRADSSREVRLFGLADRFGDQYVRGWHTALAGVWSGRSRAAKRLLPSIGLVVVSLCVAYGSVFESLRASTITPAQAVTFALGIAAMSGMLASDSDRQLLNADAFCNDLKEYSSQVAAGIELAVVIPRELASSDRSVLVADRIGFAYGANPVVEDVTFSIRPGELVAIVGPNGSGKTTLMKILAGLYEPTQGSVRVASGKHSAVPPVTLMSQRPLRLELSIRDNLLMGLSIGDDQCHSALVRAGADQFVRALPLGLSSLVGTRDGESINMSGGQWQRIALARALLRVELGSQVMILDEPSASLDLRAERELFETVRSLDGVARLLVTHRLGSVRWADHIMVLDHGRVVESGDHDSLIRAGGQYATMFEVQARLVDQGRGDV